MSVAWLLATCPDARFRHQERAIQYAERAVALGGKEDYRYLDTLAAALANNGNFDQAKSTIQEALKVVPEAQKKPLEDRLALYNKNQPYRQ